MKGLLIKDFKLMKMQKKFFSIVVVVAVGMAAFGEVASFASFIITYVTFIGAMFTLSTVNYDEFDNGNAFLFSLPISRRDYVKEKYGFGIIVAACSWLLGLAIAVMTGFARNVLNADVIAISLMVLPCVLLMLAVMLPVQFKFGGEKGRIVMFGVIGLAVIMGEIAKKAKPAGEVATYSVIHSLAAVNTGVLIAAVMVTAAVTLFLSYRISILIVNRKEF